MAGTDERLATIERKVDTILEKIGEALPRVTEHHKTLYGEGPQNPGLQTRFERHETAENLCPARIAYSDERKKINIAAIAVIFSAVSVIVAIISLFWK